MNDVKVQEPAVTETPVETETTQPSAIGETQTAETKVSGQAAKAAIPDTNVEAQNNLELDNLKKALKQEREQRKTLQREMVKERGSKALDGYPQDNLEAVMAHPFVQDLLLKQAESELQEGAKEILSQYPQIPKPIANAIIKNPRGYVNAGTNDVQTALLDIADYVDSISGEFVNATPQPKTVPIAGNNAAIGGSPQDAEVKDIVENIPPEDWTPEQEKVIKDYLKNNK